MEAEAKAWERAVAEEAEHGPEVLLRATPAAAGAGKASRQGGLRKGFLQGGRTAATAKSARQAERTAAPRARTRTKKKCFFVLSACTIRGTIRFSFPGPARLWILNYY